MVGGDLSTESLEAIGSLVAMPLNVPEPSKSWPIPRLGVKANACAPSFSIRLPTTFDAAYRHQSIRQSLLGDAELDETSRKELLTIINEESDRLDRLVGEAAQMAQLDAHAVELNLQPHHIREAIDAALEANQNTLARHEVKVNVSDSLPRVNMDLRHAEEIILSTAG